MKKSPYPVDIVLISGARPSLLKKTLDSFEINLFPWLTISKIIVNLDPFGGDNADLHECEKLILSHFPGADITIPNQPHFTKAVKNSWLKTTEKFILHLEDDWISLTNIDPNIIFPLFDNHVRSVKFSSINLNHDFKKFNAFYTGQIKRRFFGLTLKRTSYNLHSTAPGFFEGEFLRKWANLLDLSLDPEKQTRPFLNQKLFDHVKDYSCYILRSENHSHLIEDIGRDWRNKKGIKKVLNDGQSEWISTTK